MKPLIAPLLPQSPSAELRLDLSNSLAARLGRRDFLKTALGGVSLLWMSGCTSPAVRSQSPEDKLALETQTRLIGDYASAYGTSWLKVEQVGLVTGLSGTGSDPGTTSSRAALISEMQIRGVPNPNQVLQSLNNSLVLVRAFIPPGAQKGDRFDVEVRLEPQSETTSLRNGWLMDARLIEIAILDGQIHDGHVWAHAQGPILVDPTAAGEQDRGLLTHGKIPGGGVVLKDRIMGLVLHHDQKSIRTTALIDQALNKRFHTYSHGIKQGVAKAKTDEYVELAVLPRYKNNLARYMRIVRSVALEESETARIQRLRILERQLLDPVSSSDAALKLEAIGTDAIKVLTKGLDSSDTEVRFYAAEALAYLDQPIAAKVLGDAARNEPVLRAWAFTALSSMDDSGAADALRDLLDMNSAEARYGAFRALTAMNDRDPLVRGENLGGQFSYHLIATTAPPMVHVTKSFRPEIVLFGPEQRFKVPFSLEAGNKIMIKCDQGDQVTISKFSTEEADQKRLVSLKLDEVIRAVVDLGGTYPDVVQMLQQARVQNALEGRFEVDALPDQTRLYDRLIDDISEKEKATARSKGFSVASPLGELFGRTTQSTSNDDAARSEERKKSPSTR
ncbi:MAG TPA: flagellar basal body P-ring protein FlgI [Pirellulales bacterium]|jgi:flagellar basal body P-ring protein FlgI|nr:flagellar basal body P-ring protein FlgI [Pirellulales bacterium]